MKAIVVGCGRVGSAVAKKLTKSGWDVTAIEVLTDAVKSCSVKPLRAPAAAS